MRTTTARPQRPRVAAKALRSPLVVGPRSLLLLLLAWGAALALAFLLGFSIA